VRGCEYLDKREILCSICDSSGFLVDVETDSERIMSVAGHVNTDGTMADAAAQDPLDVDGKLTRSLALERGELLAMMLFALTVALCLAFR